jgi:DNA invertase Pin-like site-specific DNA recombinase
MSEPKKYVAYYRLSKKQKDDGKRSMYLGLDAQKHILEPFVKANSGTVVAEYIEIETAKDNICNERNRPELFKAIAAAELNGATLLVAKLDRLARNVAFLFTLRDTGVDFVCCDVPDANTLTIGVVATFAQYERERISQRTKDALAAKKARGWIKNVKNNFTDEGRKNSQAAIQDRIANNPNLNRARNYIQFLRNDNLTLQEIADKLNAEGFRTSFNKNWRPGSVHRMINKKPIITT